MKPLGEAVRNIFLLLKRTEPISEEYDVCWWGPYFIPQSRKWWPSHFLLYSGEVYCSLFIEAYTYQMSWKIETGEVNFERSLGPSGPYWNDEHLWLRALFQMEKRLRRALKGPESYNRFVLKSLPMECRTGKIQRHYTWNKKIKSVIPKREIAQLEKLLPQVNGLPPLSQMTLSKYLDTAAIAYDAIFKELWPLSPIEKYEKKADGRHGGLLNLASHDSQVFEKWYHSREWVGTHPWEIVFGHPHGIMIAPMYSEDKKGWNYALWVDSLGWYPEAARMAIALGQRNIPFEFRNNQRVIDALKGIDEVEVGCGLYMIHYDELREVRPDALRYIRWDPIPQILPITPNQEERVRLAEKVS